MKKIDLLVLLASTGGPKALEEICRGLTKDFNIPILLLQHMPAGFTDSFIKYLNKRCPMIVEEAKDQDMIVPGKILIAPGGVNLKITKTKQGTKKIILDRSSHPLYGITPSADVLFHSIANECKGENVLAVVLTGIGSDGTLGIKKLKEVGSCYCICQDKESSTVYGMPKSIKKAGLSDESLHLYDISKRIMQIVK